MSFNSYFSQVELSFVIPIYKSEANIPSLIQRLESLIVPSTWEVVFIDDGSPDSSFTVLKKLLETSSLPSKLIRHSRNYGEHQAVLTGYRNTSGMYVVNISDDLQNPPEDGIRLKEYAEKNKLDLVFGVYSKKKHPFWRNMGSVFANTTAHFLLDLPKKVYLNSFRCVTGALAHRVSDYDGPYPYVDGLLTQLTHNIGTLNVEHCRRNLGKSSYTIRRLVRTWLNILTSFSIMPLRIASLIGVCSAFAGLGGLLYVFVEIFIFGISVSGWASLVSTILLFGGINSFLIGMVGEYVGRIFLTVSRKPQSCIRSIDYFNTINT